MNYDETVCVLQVGERAYRAFEHHSYVAMCVYWMCLQALDESFDSRSAIENVSNAFSRRCHALSRVCYRCHAFATNSRASERKFYLLIKKSTSFLI